MALKLRILILTILLFLMIPVTQACAPVAGTTGALQSTPVPGSIPTWTPRPQDLTRTALPTATPLVPVATETPVPRTPTATPVIVMSPTTVSVTIRDGNLFVHRGPGLEYNYIGVLYAGETVIATGRDRVSRWIRIALPSKPDMDGWITTETDYTLIDGDIPNLPYIETEPARPAFIRNCTPHEIWVIPAEVKLLDKFESPYNEEQFPVGVYQIYDVENPQNKPIEEINLSEGETVDIRYDWAGERSKCE